MHSEMTSILPTDRQRFTSWKSSSRTLLDYQLSHMKAVLLPRKEIDKKDKSSDKACTKDWYNKEKCRNITCYNCDEKGHPSTHCPKGDKNPADEYFKSKNKENDDNRRSSKSIRNSAAMSKMKKDLKNQSRTFSTLNSKLRDMEEEESDLSDSYESGSSFFQRHDLGSNIQHVLHNSSPPNTEF